MISWGTSVVGALNVVRRLVFHQLRAHRTYAYDMLNRLTQARLRDIQQLAIAYPMLSTIVSVRASVNRVASPASLIHGTRCRVMP
jgi:hypothetical protein